MPLFAAVFLIARLLFFCRHRDTPLEIAHLFRCYISASFVFDVFCTAVQHELHNDARATLDAAHSRQRRRQYERFRVADGLPELRIRLALYHGKVHCMCIKIKLQTLLLHHQQQSSSFVWRWEGKGSRSNENPAVLAMLFPDGFIVTKPLSSPLLPLLLCRILV